MCWSKGSSESERYTGTTPTSSLFSTFPMGDDELKCPIDHSPCSDPGHAGFCLGRGLCCNNTGPGANHDPLCVCKPEYHGHYCQLRKIDAEYSRELMERTKAIVAFSAILGVVVIAFFVAIVVLQIKYYRRRKQRRQKVIDQEMNKAQRHDSEENGSSRRHPTTQPGYSWRESVRGRRSVLQKLKSSVSRSVPEDLFKVGLKLAAFGGGECTKSKSEENPLSHLFGHNGATVDIGPQATTVRYFSDSVAGMACPEDTSTILNDEKEKDCATKPTTITIAATTAQTSPAIEQGIRLKVDED